MYTYISIQISDLFVFTYYIHWVIKLCFFPIFHFSIFCEFFEKVYTKLILSKFNYNIITIFILVIYFMIENWNNLLTHSTTGYFQENYVFENNYVYSDGNFPWQLSKYHDSWIYKKFENKLFNKIIVICKNYWSVKITLKIFDILKLLSK